jgi:Arc/MetJ-type ribon-helix-helix transcriptional regulator
LVKQPNQQKPRGRPKILKGPVQVINLHIESELCEAIDAAVSKSDGRYTSRADYIRMAVSERLGRRGYLQRQAQRLLDLAKWDSEQEPRGLAARPKQPIPKQPNPKRPS